MSIFNSKQKIKIPYSDHDLSHNFSGTFNPGTVVPILALKIIPGDVFQIASTPDIRTQPLVSPFFTNTEIDIRYFYTRNMLLWPNFDQYITNKPRYVLNPNWNPPVHPYFSKIVGSRGSLWDYLYGAFDPNTSYDNLDPLPARMYNMVWSEYYRDEFVEDNTMVFNDGADNPSLYYLRQACYRKDYFTKSFPFTQAGDPVSLRGRVVLDNNGKAQRYVDSVGNLATAGDALFAGDGQGHTNLQTSNTPGYPVNMDPNDSLGVNIDIRDLRRATAVQKFLERSAVNGNRYAEFMLAHFGVKTADNSAFRPQYLGGGRIRLNVNPVEQTAPSSNAPLATQGGRGRVVGMVGMNKAYAFKEYGWLMAFMFIRPEADYAGGINKQFFCDGDRLDNYYLPLFQNIGMDEILMRELAYPSSNSLFDAKRVFSYQERGFQYKTMPNTVHGEFAGGSMNSWVAIRNFANLVNAPQLNANFVSVPISAFSQQAAVSGYPLFFGSIHHNIVARRPMQYRANYKI